MKNLKNLEIINISTEKGELVALVSYQDPSKFGDLNFGYDTIRIPIRPRGIQLSAYGNMLVDQSKKSVADSTPVTSDNIQMGI